MSVANTCEFRPEPQDAFSEAEYLAWVESAEPRCIDDTPEQDADLLDPTGGYEFDPSDMPELDMAFQLDYSAFKPFADESDLPF